MKYFVAFKNGKLVCCEEWDKLHKLYIGVSFTGVEAETEEQAIRIAEDLIKGENNDS